MALGVNPVDVVPGTGVTFGVSAIAVTNTAVLLAAATDERSISMLIVAPDDNAASVYIGDSTVTTANGIPLAAGAGMTIDLNHQGAALYVNGTSPDEVRWMILI